MNGGEQPTASMSEEPMEASGLIGAADIVAAFTALRHELKLQVRAGRELSSGLEELLNDAVISPLAAVSERLDGVEVQLAKVVRQDVGSPDDQLRTLANAVADAEEGLARVVAAVATQVEEFQNAAEHTEDHAGDDVSTDGSAESIALQMADLWEACVRESPWPVRTLAAGLLERLEAIAQQAVLDAYEHGGRQAASEPRPVEEAATVLEDALQGLELLLLRVRRLMEQAGLERMDVVHEAFDAERMRAVDTVADDGVPPGTVAEEVRPGYLLHGVVLRAADVCVSR